jgi:hypothetical protein
MPSHDASLRRSLETLVFPTELATCGFLAMSFSTAMPPLLADSLRRSWLSLAALGFFLLLAGVAHRGGVRLSFDSFYYVEYAKEFRRHLPESFGQSWPFGWPLLGATGGVVGLGAYSSLLVCGVFSVLVLLYLGAGLLPWQDLGRPAGLLLLIAGVSTFSLTTMLVGVLSELPFAAVLLAMVLSLSRWPRPSAIVSSALLALAALALRYAGGLAFVLLALWLIMDARRLRATGQLALAVACVAGASLVATSLLWWNYAMTGGFSGGLSRGEVASALWPAIASDLGWSLPTMGGGHPLRMLLGFWTPLRLPLGWLFLGGMLLLGFAAWRRTGSRESQALGALIVVYLAGLVILRCSRHFDDLDNARMLFPIFVPLLLVAARIPAWRRYLATGCVLMLVFNCVLCLRGASLEIAADVRPAIPFVAKTRWPAKIVVNDAAFALSAHVDAPVVRLADSNLLTPSSSTETIEYLVFAAVPMNREGFAGVMDPQIDRLVAELLASGRYNALRRTPALIVLGRASHPNPHS